MVAHLYHLLRSDIEALTWSDWTHYRDFADDWLETQRRQMQALTGGGSDG